MHMHLEKLCYFEVTACAFSETHVVPARLNGDKITREIDFSTKAAKDGTVNVLHKVDSSGDELLLPPRNLQYSRRCTRCGAQVQNTQHLQGRRVRWYTERTIESGRYTYPRISFRVSQDDWLLRL